MKTKTPATGGRRGAEAKSIPSGSDIADCAALTPIFQHTSNVSNAKAPRLDKRRGKMYWYKYNIEEMAASTAYLSPAAMGAYVRILRQYFRNMGPVPDDAREMCKITRVSLNDWSVIREALLEVFQIVDGHFVSEFADMEIANFFEKSTRGRENRSGGQKGGDTMLEDCA